MEEQWFIQIGDTREGPYSVAQLKRHPAITPDTLVWKHGWKHWRPIREVKELSELFRDEEGPAHAPGLESEAPPAYDTGSPEVIVAAGPPLPPSLIALILIGIVLYLLIWSIS